MGGLLSSENDAAKRLQEERRIEEQRRQQRLSEERIRQNQQRVFYEQLQFERLRQEQRRQQQIQSEKIRENARQQKHLVVRVNVIHSAPSTGYTMTKVLPSSKEYAQVQRKFRHTAKPAMRVISIQKINNPFVKARYHLKLAEARRHHHDALERDLYHGTMRSKLDSICRNNLDYRKCTQHKFGSGVSFSPISYYASHYSDKGKNVEKIMLVCKVIVMNLVEGHANVMVPPIGADATRNHNGHVIVKYDDDTYYPEYIITYKFIQNTPASPATNVTPTQQMFNLSLYDYDYYDD